MIQGNQVDVITSSEKANMTYKVVNTSERSQWNSGKCYFTSEKKESLEYERAKSIRLIKLLSFHSVKPHKHTYCSCAENVSLSSHFLTF